MKFRWNPSAVTGFLIISACLVLFANIGLALTPSTDNEDGGLALPSSTDKEEDRLATTSSTDNEDGILLVASSTDNEDGGLAMTSSTDNEDDGLLVASSRLNYDEAGVEVEDSAGNHLPIEMNEQVDSVEKEEREDGTPWRKEEATSLEPLPRQVVSPEPKPYRPPKSVVEKLFFSGIDFISDSIADFPVEVFDWIPFGGVEVDDQPRSETTSGSWAAESSGRHVDEEDEESESSSHRIIRRIRSTASTETDERVKQFVTKVGVAKMENVVNQLDKLPWLIYKLFPFSGKSEDDQTVWWRS